MLHVDVRTKFWGYAKGEKFSNDQLINEEYIGIRPAPGYPACPDHTEKKTLFKLLKANENIKVKLTESYAMTPSSSVSGFYFQTLVQLILELVKFMKTKLRIMLREKVLIKRLQKNGYLHPLVMQLKIKNEY